jgi:hypothetical protein
LQNAASFSFNSVGIDITIDASRELAGAKWDATITGPTGVTHTITIGNSTFNGTWENSYVVTIPWDGGNVPMIGAYGLSFDIHSEQTTWLASYTTHQSSDYYTCGVITTPNISYDPYGCTDPAADNYCSSCSINEVSDTDSSDPCTYVGCTDQGSTFLGFGTWHSGPPYFDPSWNAIAATNHDSAKTTPCNTVNDNDCCTYELGHLSLNVADTNNGHVRPRFDVHKMRRGDGGNTLFKFHNSKLSFWDANGAEIVSLRIEKSTHQQQVSTSSFYIDAVVTGLWADIFRSYEPPNSGPWNVPYRTSIYDQVVNVKFETEMKNDSEPGGTYNLYSVDVPVGDVNGGTGQVGCTDPYGGIDLSNPGVGRNPAATIDNSLLDNANNGAALNSCAYDASGCSNVQALNYNPNIADHAGDPASCFYGSPIDFSGITVSHVDTVNSSYDVTKLIFSGNFDPTTLTDPNTGINHQRNHTGTGSPLFAVTGTYKLPNETEWSPVEHGGNYGNIWHQNLASPTGPFDELGVWTDDSTGNAWSGLPWLYSGWMSAITNRVLYNNNTGNDFRIATGTSVRLQIRAIVDWTANTDMIPGGYDAGGGYTPYQVGNYWITGWEPRGGTSSPNSNTYPYMRGGDIPLKTVYGREIPYDGFVGNPKFQVGLPYIEYTVT